MSDDDPQRPRTRGPSKRAKRPDPARPRARTPQRSSAGAGFDASPTEHQRQALSAQGGEARSRGAREEGALLARAMEASGEDADRLTHGFHTYPARMHPDIAAVVLDGLGDASGEAGTVLDPFCGSGTVLLEASIRGRRAVGTDLNPVGLRVAEAKTLATDAKLRARFLDALAEVTQRSLARVRERVPSRAPIPRTEVEWYQVHVLKELAGLHAEIRALRDPALGRQLEMVFSSLLVKFSRQRAETSRQQEDKRIRKGLVSEFFERRGRELVERFEATEAANAALARTRGEVVLRQGDARDLPRLLGRLAPVELILSSPPYGGTYDYVDHHARRYPWLGFDPRPLAEGEIGARRNLGQGDPRHASARWDDELLAALASMRAVLAPGGRAVLLIGDGNVGGGGGRRLPADVQLERLAPRAELRFIASAMQARPDWRGGPARAEHLVMLARD